MQIKDLHPYFFICTEGHEIKHGTTMVKVEDCIASAIAYMFNVKIPRRRDDGAYLFPTSSVNQINSQLTFFKFKQDESGYIPMWQFLILSNSSKFPYKIIGVDSIFYNNSTYCYYHFLLKENPIKEITI